MKLRKLELKDTPLMFEWMHDVSVVAGMRKNFAEITMKDCETFIIESWNDRENFHLGIADDMGTYLGTVSLKQISNGSAEFAIVMRKIAMGKGFAKDAMEEMFRIGFEDMKLKQIYWYVSPYNRRAVRFYDKNGYKRVEIIYCKRISHQDNYIWYQQTNPQNTI